MNKKTQTADKKIEPQSEVRAENVDMSITTQNNSGFNAEMLIAKAIDKNVQVETMEKLLTMRRELKAEWAKEQFDRAMTQFQADCPTIEKTKGVKTKTGIIAYKYAPIESIIEQVREILSRYGFSYSSNMQLLESGVKVTLKVTHSAGHSEITEMTVPLGTKTDIMSQSQVVAAASTFAKRYAFCNAFGILTGDEDTDAAPTLHTEPGPAKTEMPETSFPRMTTKQRSFVFYLLDQKGKTKDDLEAVCDKLYQRRFSNLSLEQARQVIDRLEKLDNASQQKPVERDLEKTHPTGEPEEPEIDIDEVDAGIEQMKMEA